MTVPETQTAGKVLRLVLPGREPEPVEPEAAGGELVGPVYEAELVEEQGGEAVPVDQPAGATVWTPPWQQEREWRPVVAPWLASRDERRAAGRWAMRRLRHQAAFHAGRAPVYAGRALSPVSISRALGRTARWASEPELSARVAGASRSETKEYLALREQLAVARRARGAVVSAGAVGFGGLEAAMAFGGHDLAMWALGLLAAAGLGVAGRRRDKPLLDVAVVAEAKAPKLTSDVVITALAGLGIAALAKDDAVRFVAPIQRDGPGYRADIDLPQGVTAGDVIKQRDKLAANLRRPLGCVWPEAAARVHPGRLVLWVGDQAMSDAPNPAWPLLKSGTVNLFKPVPFGTDQRGRLAMVTLIYASAVIGAIPRMGKTFAVRLLLLAAALDVRVELHPYDLKGTGDFDALEPVSHRFRAGDDREDIEYALADLTALREEMRRRTKVIRSLPKDVCPESKVTDQLASVRSYRLHPILVAADECQRWFEHPEHGAKFEEICADLVRRGPATGIMLLLSTQRPDAKSIPKVISDNAVMRFCLKVLGHHANDMVLGSGMWTAGYQAATFAFEDKGIGLLAGEGDAPRIVRTAYVDGRQAEQVVARARAMRIAAGTITGHAAGEVLEEDAGPDFSLLADLLTVMGEEKAHSDVLCARLAEQWPDRYDGWQPATLASALSPLGVKTQRQVWAERQDGGNPNRAGVRRDDLVSAVDARV